MAAKTLTIDGTQISAENHTTVLQAAAEAGVKIPTLCHLEGVYDVGACRLCLIEVPMGTPLRTIVEHMGGGAPDGGRIKAVQTGGPSGGCIPAQHLDTPVDYESLTKLGSIMGSGGMIVMDETTNMVDVARYFLEFCMDESCGKCIPCRTGTVQMHHLLEKILARKATALDLANLEELCDMVRHTSLCGLGQNAPNPVQSTLRFFRHEYDALLQPELHGANGAAQPSPLAGAK